MADPYVGEIRMFGGNFAPSGWAFCNGALLPIAGNEVLFSLIGTTYGGDGQATFQLPDLQGRVPIHQGSGFTIGQKDGVEEVTLTVQNLPIHTHPLTASTSPGSTTDPAGMALANAGRNFLYGPDAPRPSAALAGGSGVAAGGSQPHTNVQPFLCVTFIISLYGIYPSQG